MKRFRQRKAFTIVEMVIVIAVIAILATVLVPTISGVIQKANHSADQQFVASLNVQLALWQVDNGEIKSESDLREAIKYLDEQMKGTIMDYQIASVTETMIMDVYPYDASIEVK